MVSPQHTSGHQLHLCPTTLPRRRGSLGDTPKPLPLQGTLGALLQIPGVGEQEGGADDRRGLGAQYPRSETDRNDAITYRKLDFLRREPAFRADQEVHCKRSLSTWRDPC